MRTLRYLVVVCLLVVLNPVPGFSDQGEDELQPLKLPAPVFESVLRNRDGAYILRVDSSQAAGLPELEIYTREKEVLSSRRVPLLRNYIGAASTLLPVSDAVTEVWDPGRDNALYARCTLSNEEIISAYRLEGWTLVDEEELPRLEPPLSEDDEKEVRRLMKNSRREDEAVARHMKELKEAAAAGDASAEEDLKLMSEWHDSIPSAEEREERFRKMVIEGNWRVLPGPEGWIALITPYASAENFEVIEAPEELKDVLEHFPFATLFDRDRQDLFLAAILFSRPDAKDPDEEEAQVEEDAASARKAELFAEMQKIREEMDQLSGQDFKALTARTGNMLLAINEIDGGFDLSLEAEMPGEPDESLTSGVVQMGLTFLRMAVIQHSPSLARELLDVILDNSSGRVYARTTISHDALMDYLKTAVEKGKRIRELSTRLEALQEELQEIYRAEEREQRLSDEE